MTEKRLDFFSFKVIFVFILIVLVTAFRPQVGLSQEALNLSGRYKGYNVILIILDALRPDHLSCYGYNKKTSPNIDALAKQGVLFSNAFSQASYTLPSVTSIFTSVYPYSHNVMHILKEKVPDKIDTLAQILSKYGYNTVWFGLLNDFHTGSAPGLLKGFREKYGLPMKRKDKKILEWVKEHQKDTFFLSIHSYSTHERFFPFIRVDNKFSCNISRDLLRRIDMLEKVFWDCLQEILKNDPEVVENILGKDFVEKYLMRSYTQGVLDSLLFLAQTEKQKVFLEKIFSRSEFVFFESLNKEQILDLLSLLDGALYWLDKDMIGDLVKGLKELNLYDKTIIIITADHGNEYKEHGNLFHGPWLYDEVIHVPLIFHLPNLKKPRVLKELTQSIDILPTTLDLLSISIPHQAQGISLTGLIEGKKSALNNKYVFCQGIPVGTLAIRSKDWKLIWKPQEDKGGSDIFELSLFDLKKDPRELHNVINDKPQVAGRLKNELAEWMKSLVVYQQEKSEFVPGVDEQTKERIKKTGYW